MNPLKIRDDQRVTPTLETATSTVRPFVPTVSGCRARVTADDEWPDEAPTLPSGNPIHCRRPELSHATVSDDASPRANALDESAFPSSSDAEVAEGAIRWHYVRIGDEIVRDSMPPWRRHNVRRQAAIDIAFDRDTQLYSGLSQDISEGGVFIATYRVQPIGTPICLSFELPDGTKITARGVVRWIRESSSVCRPGIGVAFTELTSEALAALAQFCRHCAPLYVEV